MTLCSNVVGSIACISIPTPFKIGPVHVYVLKGDALTLIDSGPNTIDSPASLEHGLKQAGYSIRDIDQIVLTHHHVDHLGLVEYIQSQKPVRVYAHQYAVSYIEMKDEFADYLKAFYEGVYDEFGVPRELTEQFPPVQQLGLEYACQSAVDHFLEDGEPIPGLPGWRTLYRPGHSASDVCLYHENQRVLFSGDHLLEHVDSNAVITPERIHFPLSQYLMYRSSLEKTADLEVDIIYPGHGKPFSGHKLLIERRLANHYNQALAVRNWVKEEPQTVFSLTKRMFPKYFDADSLLTSSKVFGYLSYLQQLDSDLKVDQENGKLLFYY